MEPTWTLPELVEEVAARIAALPAQANGQVRSVPDDRTIRYYGTIGLLDRPAAMRGRTALYGRRHLAQVVAIKRLQSAGKSLAEIQTLWTTLTDDTLARMAGVTVVGARATRSPRKEFWRTAPGVPGEQDVAWTPAFAGVTGEAARTGEGATAGDARVTGEMASTGEGPTTGAARVTGARLASPGTELRIELAPGAVLCLAIDESHPLTAAALRAIRTAAAPLITELARCPLATNDRDLEPTEPGDAP